jgi:lipooligosaccharide transport system ATP-binding protein
VNNIAIKAHHIFKSYGDLFAVKDLSFEVEEAVCYGLLGPNGAGKTTMMKMIYGKAKRNKHNATIIDVFGFDPLRDELAIKSLSGVVQQDNSLDSELNVTDNLFIYSKYYGIPRNVALKRIDELLDFMELSEKRKARIDDLSGGMKRRLVIARALINNPKLLILDEPTTGLDPQVRHLIWDRLRELKKNGVTILLTTHYMEEAFQICDKILIMHKGEKVIEGNPSSLLESNIEKFVLEIITNENRKTVESELQDRKYRIDASHGMTFVFSNDMAALQELTTKLPSGGYYMRQSNLEDLFMNRPGGSSMTNNSTTHPGLMYPSFLHRVMSVWYRHMRVYTSELVGNAIPPFLEPLLSIAGIGLGLSKHIGLIGDLSFLQFMSSGILVTSAMFTSAFECTYGTYFRLETEGDYDGMLGTPLKANDLIIGEILWSGTKGFFFTLSVLIILYIFGLVPLGLSLLTPFVGFMTGLMFAGLSLFITSFTKSMTQFNFYFTGFLTPLFYFSGVFFPISDLPAAVQGIAEALPLIHSVRLVRSLCFGQIGPILLWDIAYMIAFSLIFGIIAVRTMRKDLSISFEDLKDFFFRDADTLTVFCFDV